MEVLILATLLAIIITSLFVYTYIEAKNNSDLIEEKGVSSKGGEYIKQTEGRIKIAIIIFIILVLSLWISFYLVNSTLVDYVNNSAMNGEASNQN